jgi:hypothetical protein
LRNGESYGREFGSGVGTVTEWLVGRLTAGTPVVGLAFFQINKYGRIAGAFGFVHEVLSLF